ncbi:MAG: hypothetical protein FRX49_07186 [Trebouxia sp. A1-2]|nr:MAG: hypothetical protein FRX49_07186 [Trebouxia sp. A1-2]
MYCVDFAAEGFKVFAEREVPCELRSDAGRLSSDAGSVEAIRVRILVRGSPPELEAVRVELTSESDLFFHYTHTIGPAAFRQHMQEAQKLMVDFNDYPSVFLRMLSSCIQAPQNHIAVLLMEPSGNARMDFIQNMEYKFVELLSCQFQASSEEHIKQQVTYRYNAVKSRLALMQARLADINALVKLKNPSLLLQLQSVPPRMPGLTASILGASGMAAYSPQKTTLTTLTRSPSNIRDTIQQSGQLNKSPSQKGAWAY